MRTEKEKPLEEDRPYNLTGPEKVELKIDGETYVFSIAKYDPPYFHRSLLEDRTDQYLTTPEGTARALWSSVRRDSDWYKSLHDEGARKALIKRDKKSDGQLLEDVNKDNPLPDPVETGNYDKYYYKVEMEHAGKNYAILHHTRVFKGKEEDYPGFKTFIKQGDQWLLTRDIDGHPVRRLVALKTYEEVKEILEEGSWSLKHLQGK